MEHHWRRWGWWLGGWIANHMNFCNSCETLREFFEHACIIDRFQDRSDDYSPFFSFLHAEIAGRSIRKLIIRGDFGQPHDVKH